MPFLTDCIYSGSENWLHFLLLLYSTHDMGFCAFYDFEVCRYNAVVSWKCFFSLPACWICNLWQSFWSWSCKKCIKCKPHVAVNVHSNHHLLIEVVSFKSEANGAGSSSVCHFCSFSYFCNEGWMGDHWPNFSRPVTQNQLFCLSQFKGRAIFGNWDQNPVDLR